MKNYLSSILFALVLVACSSDTSSKQDYQEPLIQTEPIGQNIFLDEVTESIDTNAFKPILDSSFYKNPQQLVLELGRYYDYFYNNKTQLLSLQQHKMYAWEDTLNLLVVQTPLKQDSSCLFAMDTECFLWNQKGHLLQHKKVISAQLLPIMKDSLALLMTVERDCKGEGLHHLYTYESGRWIDILNNLQPENMPISYDANPQNGGLFAKNKLKASLVDVNDDGHMDFVLKGSWLQLEDSKGKKYNRYQPYKIEPKEYHYIYKVAKESFVLK